MSDRDIFANLEEAYAQRLAKFATAWQVKHPEEAKALREEVVARFRRDGKPDPEPGSFAWLTIEAAVVEAIRAKKGWPTLRQYEVIQAGKEPQAFTPAAPPRPNRIIRDVPDHKAAAAGDR